MPIESTKIFLNFEVSEPKSAVRTRGTVFR